MQPLTVRASSSTSGLSDMADRRVRIKRRHIQLAVWNDEELSRRVRGVTIAQGGAFPHIHPQLFPKQKPLQVEDANQSSFSTGRSSQTSNGKSSRKSQTARKGKAVKAETKNGSIVVDLSGGVGQESLKVSCAS